MYFIFALLGWVEVVVTFSFALCIRNKYVINGILFLYVAKIIKRFSQELYEVFVLAVRQKKNKKWM